jgi:hypothetical protein
MGNPMKSCESCKGTGKVVDSSKKGHMESSSSSSSSSSYNKSKTDMKKVPTSKPKNPSIEKGKK